MDKKELEYIQDNIKWSKSVQGGWCGGFALKDGYGITIVSSPDMKMREAKSFIKENLPEMVAKAAKERNTSIM